MLVLNWPATIQLGRPKEGEKESGHYNRKKKKRNATTFCTLEEGCDATQTKEPYAAAAVGLGSASRMVAGVEEPARSENTEAARLWKQAADIKEAATSTTTVTASAQPAESCPQEASPSCP